MIDDTIRKLEAQLETADAMPAERRRELLQLLDQLKAEVGALSQTHNEAAQSIAGFTQVSAHEATRETPNRHLLDLSLQGLRSSVEGFEKTHPKLFQLVNSVSNMLSNLGI